jgi:DnaK suppressor protein
MVGKNKIILTEEQILAMNDKDYMNLDQLNFFKNKLEDLRDGILKYANQTTENLRETIFAPDPVDRASIEEEHALELRTRDRERKLLRKIEQSIASIEEGTYGWCEETGEAIGLKRLIARPTATLSLEAQERREHRQKMFGE